MNERIRELARQAGAHVSTRNLMSNPPQHIETVELWDDRIEKFAELIVRECIDEVSDLMDYEGEGVDLDTLRFVRRIIKEHFGVEE